jgi:Fe-S cluster biogenesis protein NfuA
MVTLLNLLGRKPTRPAAEPATQPRAVQKDFNATATEVTRAIAQAFEQYIRPAVREDKGDIVPVSFDAANGVLYVEMSGACIGCPKVNETLQKGVMGVMQAKVPQVRAVKVWRPRAQPT